jgi:hypothetical protein
LDVRQCSLVLQMFRRNLLSPSLRSKNKPSEQEQQYPAGCLLLCLQNTFLHFFVNLTINPELDTHTEPLCLTHSTTTPYLKRGRGGAGGVDYKAKLQIETPNDIFCSQGIAVHERFCDQKAIINTTNTFCFRVKGNVTFYFIFFAHLTAL